MASSTIQKTGWGAVESHAITSDSWTAAADGIAIVILGPTTGTVGSCRIRGGTFGIVGTIQSSGAGLVGLTTIPIIKGLAYSSENQVNVSSVTLYFYPLV